MTYFMHIHSNHNERHCSMCVGHGSKTTFENQNGGNAVKSTKIDVYVDYVFSISSNWSNLMARNTNDKLAAQNFWNAFFFQIQRNLLWLILKWSEIIPIKPRVWSFTSIFPQFSWKNDYLLRRKRVSLTQNTVYSAKKGKSPKYRLNE